MASENKIRTALIKKGYTEKEVDEIIEGLENGKKEIRKLVEETKEKGILTEKEAEEDKKIMERMFVSDVVDSLLTAETPRKGFIGFKAYTANFDKLAREVWETDLFDRLANPIKFRGDTPKEFSYKMRNKQRFWIEGSPFFKKPPEKSAYLTREEIMPKPIEGGAFKGSVGGIIDNLIKKRKRRK